MIEVIIRSYIQGYILFIIKCDTHISVFINAGYFTGKTILNTKRTIITKKNYLIAFHKLCLFFLKDFYFVAVFCNINMNSLSIGSEDCKSLFFIV